MDKFNGRYRISSTRLQNWDYGWNAFYFITICTNNREHYFGEIINATMHLSKTGNLVQHYWNEIPKKFPYIELDEFVVMPNHLHGIVIINKTTERENAMYCRDAINRVSTGKSTNKPITHGGKIGNKNPMLHDNLSRVIRWYKGRMTFEGRKIEHLFAWQPRFYDHIIRDHDSYLRIAEYIKTNPANWQADRFFD